jgi:flavin reductase (DIM6/NTAB) family NADH-FMN oxidoreductase RutF
LDQRAFRDALGAFPTGVTVITTDTDDGPRGITANSFASLSLDPPLVLWSPALTSTRASAFASAHRYTIHILSAAQEQLAIGFAESGEAPFAGREWATGATGPEFAGCAAVLRCEQREIFPGGDHCIIVGEVLSYVHDPAAEPLVFHRGSFPSLR